jgi:redox-sensitive bicupin YhaK (pirin superfamily)
MTAGSGIMHQEMPHGDDQGAHARFSALGQPAGREEDDDPRHQDVKSKDVAEVIDGDGTKVRVIIGECEGSFRDASEPKGVLTERHVEDDNPVRSMTGNRSLVMFGGAARRRPLPPGPPPRPHLRGLPQHLPRLRRRHAHPCLHRRRRAR